MNVRAVGSRACPGDSTTLRTMSGIRPGAFVVRALAAACFFAAQAAQGAALLVFAPQAQRRKSTGARAPPSTAAARRCNVLDIPAMMGRPPLSARQVAQRDGTSSVESSQTGPERSAACGSGATSSRNTRPGLRATTSGSPSVPREALALGHGRDGDSLEVTGRRTTARTTGSDAGSIGSDALPMRNEARRTRSDECPTSRDSSPARRAALRASSDALPTRNDALPMNRDDLPTGSDASPIEQEALPGRRGAL
jgi:hypothetical protein